MSDLRVGVGMLPAMNQRDDVVKVPVVRVYWEVTADGTNLADSAVALKHDTSFHVFHKSIPLSSTTNERIFTVFVRVC